MRTRVCWYSLVLAALCVSNTKAGTIQVYAVNAGNPNKSPQNLVFGDPPPNVDGYFDVYVKTDIEIVYMSLDVFLTGNAVTIQSVIVQQPLNGAETRWINAFNGVVGFEGRNAISADAYTLGGANRGMNPANASTDAGYNLAAGAFHYARVNYHTSSELGAVSVLKLGVGVADINTNPQQPTAALVFLGVTPQGQTAEPPACNTANFDCPGATSLYPDSEWVPEPASISLAVLAVLGLAGCGLLHRSCLRCT